jgi:glutathione synthase/RimK-type ligase-like ATP-grasp enzyme
VKRVLLVASEEHDSTLAVVCRFLAKHGDVEPTIFDSQLAGSQAHVSMRLERATEGPWRIESDRYQLDLSTLHCVWYRRWHNPLVIRENSESTQQFAQSNWDMLFEGLWSVLKTRWINHPSKQRLANNKPLQLFQARRIGFAVPDTLFTSNPSDAQEFVDTHPEGVICKTISHLGWKRSLATVLLTPEHLQHLSSLALAPAAFQEYVKGEYDIRVVVIGDRLFAAEVRTAKGKDPVDWRLDINNPWRKHSLPSKVADTCIRLTKNLGLIYGAIDLRLCSDGRYVFFEINPGGQFLFVEVWTGLPISAALADAIAS